MKMKVNKLSQSQEWQLIEFREEYLKIGTSCEDMNRDIAKNAISEMYKMIDEPSPKFFFCQSPFQAILEISFLTNLGANLGDNLGDNLWNNLRAILRANLGDNLEANLRAILRANLGDRYVHTHLWGQLDAYWVAFCLFPHLHIRPMYTTKDLEVLSLWDNITKSCGWWYPYKNICFVCDRFESLYQDSKNRLHNLDGPAMSFRDGYSVYAVNGVRVPAWIIEEPNKITPKTIQDEDNAEIRRVMMQKYGWHRLLNDVNANLVDKHPDPTIGELWRWSDKDGVDIQVLRVQNGTPDPETEKEKWYSIRVPLEFSRAIDANRNSYPICRDMTDQEFIEWNKSRT